MPVSNLKPEELARIEANDQLSTAQQWLANMEGFVIQTDEQQAQVVGLIQQVKLRQKALEDKRTTFTKPLNQLLRDVNALFKPPQQKFEHIERMCKAMITTYMEAKTAANVAAIQAAAVAPTPVVAQQTLAQVRPVEAPANVSVRYVWQYQVVNPDLVPRELCSPDSAKIRAYMASTTAPNVPGIQFVQAPVTSVRQG